MRARGPRASFKGVKAFLRGLKALLEVFQVLRNIMTVQETLDANLEYQPKQSFGFLSSISISNKNCSSHVSGD